MKNNSLLNNLGKKYHSSTIRFFISSLLVNSLLMLMPLLLISLYTIIRTGHESSADAQKKASVILNQADNLMESFYTHVDNAYLFFASNPRVTLQLRNAFGEKSLSLDSIKSVENLSLGFQNLMYTDGYLRNIYVYYKNNYSRIFLPLSSKLITFPADSEKQVLASYSHSGTEDVWMEFSNESNLYSEYKSPSLLIFRKLFRRTTDIQNGLIMFCFNAGKLKNELSGFLEYPDQQLFLIDRPNRLVWPAAGKSKNEELLSLAEKITALPDFSSGKAAIHDYNSYTAAYLHSPRSYGFSYLLLTPRQEIHKTTISLRSMYFFTTMASITAACVLAYVKTRHDYKYLDRIIRIFSNPDTTVTKFRPSDKKKSSPFEYILMNVIHLFIEQDYLKVQDSEKAAKLQLSKMQALQHQINPHFLHNALNNIYWESIKLIGSENRCSRMISCLSSMMRYSLSDPQENVTVCAEINYLKKYLEIMKLRYSDKFYAEFRIDPDCFIYPVKKMLLQPLVENAICHGIKEKMGKGLIRISIHCKKGKGRIYFSIYDSGNGIFPDKLAAIQIGLREINRTPTEHIGLVNTNSRLILSYGEASCLHISSRPHDFTVIWFSIPIPEGS